MPSGYFSTPETTLDPALFKGDVLRPEVRSTLLEMLYDGLQLLSFHEPWSWVRAWLAGSGASYQWAADRGNGDLDILFGADYDQFLATNTWFPKLTVAETARYIDQLLKKKYWPDTSSVQLRGSIYEVTFFWNPTTTTDITTIHPYAAYDLTKGEWSVRPPELHHNPRDLYPEEWFEWTQHDADVAKGIGEVYRTGSPSARLHALTAARANWEMIHEGRKRAFSDTGQGYGDWNNFRWQRAKELGTADELWEIVSSASDSDNGPAADAPADIITRAALRYASNRYWS